MKPPLSTSQQAEKLLEREARHDQTVREISDRFHRAKLEYGYRVNPETSAALEKASADYNTVLRILAQREQGDLIRSARTGLQTEMIL